VKKVAACAVLVVAAIVGTLARGGHEFPVYPGYYPHRIRIETIAPDRAPDLLKASKIQAYVGPNVNFGGSLPDSIGSVESLGSFVIIRVNPESPLAEDDASACTVTRSVVRELAARPGTITIHPYPVTPLHGDYLSQVDLAETAKARLLNDGAARRVKVRASSLAKDLLPPNWLTQAADWQAEVDEVSAAALVASAKTQVNGWIGPPWVRTGWFQATQLLESSIDNPVDRDRVQANLRRLQTADYRSAVERINLERDLVSALTASCRALVAGYTLNREYVSIEYSAGIENIGFDSITGLNSSIFIRTAKLKDFPWNAVLSLGIETPPTAAWNPIAGFNDSLGSLMWSAVGDPAVLPAPNDSGWMLNRLSDVRATPPR